MNSYNEISSLQGIPEGPLEPGSWLSASQGKETEKDHIVDGLRGGIRLELMDLGWKSWLCHYDYASVSLSAR